MGTRQPHGIHIRFAASADIAQLICTCDSRTDAFGQRDPGRIIGEEGHAAFHLPRNGGVHLGMAMTEDHWPRANQVIDIFLPILVDDT